MTEPPKPLVLTVEERQSPLWRVLMAHMQKRLTEARQANDGNLGEADTSRIRGRIAEIKAFMALNDEPKDL